jgi:hypothetical protein
MKEIFDIITFINTYYNNFIFTSNDDIDLKIDKSIMFLIYIFIIFIILRSAYNVIPVVLIVILLIIKINYKRDIFITKEKCRRPTKDNPFMNILFEAEKEEACADVDEKEILEKYNDNLNKNMQDLFDKKTGQLYYKTNNVTSIPNKYKDFLNFIGKTNDLKDNNCKYDGVNCLKYNDLRIR